MLGGEVLRGPRLRFDAENETQLLRLPLHRFHQRPAPAAESDYCGGYHSGRIPASRTSRPHLAISCLMNAPNSSGAMGAGSRPRPPRFASTSGLASPAATTSCTFCTTAFGVFAGATSPYQIRVS